MLWFVFAFLTLLVLAVLLYPLLRGNRTDSPERIDFDIVVYRRQLKELEEEIESGLLTPDQADAARAEIGRRMLTAEDEALKSPALPLATARRARLAAVVAIAVAVPLGAALLYGQLGSPQLPGAPYAWRQKHDPDLIAASSADALAASLKRNPSPAGYRRLANMYFAARQYDKAVEADHRAIDLGSDDAATWSEFGEAIVMKNGGAVVPEALVAFIKSIGTDPKDARAQFYIGLAEAQIGNLRRAVAIWRNLENASPPNAPWVPLVRQHVEAFSRNGGFDPNSVPPAPPSVDALQAAVTQMGTAMGQRREQDQTAMTAAAPPAPLMGGADQSTFIQAMVQKLADRMKDNPRDAAGWTRLAHAYNVLGEYDKAQSAIDHAVRLKPDDVDVLSILAETQKNEAGPGNDTPDAFVSTMRKILQIDPSNIPALYYVGIAEQKSGNPSKAREMWTRALNVAQADDPLANEIRARLNAFAAGPR